MSDIDSTTITRGDHAGLPYLTEDNFVDWEMQVIAYLTGIQDHARVITPVRQANGKGKLLAPIQPDPANDSDSADDKQKAAEEIQNWHKSERIVLGCLMATAGNLHREAILKYRQTGGPIYTLYAKICDYHQQGDAGHSAWMSFLAIRKLATESYMTYYRRLKFAYEKIDRITPAEQSPEDWARQLTLYILLSGLPHDDTLRTSLTTQKDLSLADAASAMLRFDTSKKLAESKVEQAHAAFGGGCWTCSDKGHVARDCPHREAVQQLVTRRRNAGNGNSNAGKFRRVKGKGKGKGDANTAHTNSTGANNNPNRRER
jgi:hypothetical protein